MLALAMVGLAGVVIFGYRVVSGIESVLASQLVAAVLQQRTVALPAQAIVILNLGTPRTLGLEITPECTSAFLIAPMVLTAATLLWMRPQQRKQVLLGLAITVSLLFATNQLRILGLVMLVNTVGFEHGYYWGHTILGSVVSILGGGISLIAFVYWTVVRGQSVRGATRVAGSDSER